MAEYPLPSKLSEPYITQFQRIQQGNIIATWTSTPAIWQAPLAIYYIILNGLTTLIEYQSAHTNKQLKFSDAQDDLILFAKEEEDLLNSISEGKNISSSFTLRFLIFSEKEYEDYEEGLKTLIRLHHYFHMHCIPLVEEKLLELLTQIEMKTYEQKIKEFREKFEIHVADKIPNILIIENFLDYTPPKSGELNSGLWVIEKGSVKSYPEYLAEAKEVIRIIASYYAEAKWDKYDIVELIVAK
jgi:hypothetical protein